MENTATIIRDLDKDLTRMMVVVANVLHDIQVVRGKLSEIKDKSDE